jgi:hypothetical protein
MKKYLLGIIIFLFSANIALSGPLELFNQMDTVRGSIMDDELAAYAQIRNLTINDVEFELRFEFLKKVDEHSVAVCWDVCFEFTDKAFVAPWNMTLEAGALSPFLQFSGHLQSFKQISDVPEYTQPAVGETIVRFIFAPVGGTVEDELHYDVVFVVTDPTSVNDAFVEYGVNIFPNPTSDFININFDSAPTTDSKISIYDIQGNKLSEYRMDANVTDKMIGIGNLPTGTYYLKMQNDGKYGAKQFNVVR